MNKPLKIVYLPGPVDAVSVYQHWVKGKDDPSHFAVIYVQQFYDVCKELNAKGYVISARDEQTSVDDEQFKIRYRPVPFLKSSPLLFHIGQIWSGFRLLLSALRFRADVVVVTQTRVHWFVLAIFPWLGIQVIPTLHCTLWEKYAERSWIRKLIHSLDSYVFIHSCVGILAISEDAATQVRELTNHKNKPIIRFFPTYRRERFQQIEEPDLNVSAFHVLFVGRIETEKGVYTLLEIAKRFHQEERNNIIFDICGTGSQLEKLRLAAEESGLSETFICHGYCKQAQLQAKYNLSHIVIVPTTTAWSEGFNKVVLEGVLSGRPVITSSVCPALSDVKEATVEVEPDNLEQYANAIIKLSEDRDFYQLKRQGALNLQEKFYGNGKSWGQSLKSILVTLLH